MAKRKRFQPMSMELGGYVKTFFILWIIIGGVTYIALGLDKWAFYAAISLGFLFTIVAFLLLLWITGVQGPIE